MDFDLLLVLYGRHFVPPIVRSLALPTAARAGGVAHVPGRRASLGTLERGPDGAAQALLGPACRRRRITPATPARTSISASAPRTRSGSGRESALPGLIRSIASPKGPFLDLRPAAVVGEPGGLPGAGGAGGGGPAVGG